LRQKLRPIKLITMPQLMKKNIFAITRPNHSEVAAYLIKIST